MTIPVFIHYTLNDLGYYQGFFFFLSPSSNKASVNMCVCAQSCPTLCDPIDCSPLGSSVHGIFAGKNAGLGGHFLLQDSEYVCTYQQIY